MCCVGLCLDDLLIFGVVMVVVLQSCYFVGLRLRFGRSVEVLFFVVGLWCWEKG